MGDGALDEPPWCELLPLTLSFMASVVQGAGGEQCMSHGSGAQQALAPQPDPPETGKSSSERNPALPGSAIALLLPLTGGWHQLKPNCWAGQPGSDLLLVFSLKAIRRNPRKMGFKELLSPGWLPALCVP